MPFLPPRCNSSILRCERSGAGAAPAGEPIPPRAKDEESNRKAATLLYPVRVRVARPIPFQTTRTREPANSPVLETGGARGSTGVRDPFQLREGFHDPTPTNDGLVAQPIEHPPLKRRVGGLNPPEAATFHQVRSRIELTRRASPTRQRH